MSRIRRGPGAYRRQAKVRRARLEAEALFGVLAHPEKPLIRDVLITYRKRRRVVMEPA